MLCAISVAYMTTIMVLLGIAVPLAHGTAPTTPNSTANQRAGSSLCVRPGYVFIPCKQPANGKQKLTSLPTSNTASAKVTSPITPGSLQSICDQTRSCAAYTTGGIYYTVSAKTGRIGPLIDMSNCQPYKNITRVQDCQGIYVFDGQMPYTSAPTSSWGYGFSSSFSPQDSPPPSQQAPPDPPPGGGSGWPFGTTANSAATAVNNGIANGGVFANSAAGNAATSVPNTLQGGYYRAVASGGGIGKLGQEHCTLC